MKVLIIAASALLITACSASVDSSKMISSKVSSAMTVPVSQSFEITIDGHQFVLKPDEPTEGNVIVASVVGGIHLNISATNKLNNFTFSLSLQASPLVPGTYAVFNCFNPQICEDDKALNASIMPFNPADSIELKKAYKHPPLGMSPMTVVISSIDDVIWPGAGPSKRIKGSFSGGLGDIAGYGNTAHLNGPMKRVEGKFDLYTALR